MLCACAPTTVQHTVRIETDPPGARIMVESDYVGDSPIDYTFIENRTNWNTRYFVVEAVPKPDWGAGMMVQRTTFKDWAAPKRVFFDMRLRPVYPAQPIDANVNVRGQN